MVGRITLTFLGGLKMWRTHKPSPVDLHLLVFRTKGMPITPPLPPPSMSSELDNIVVALSILTSTVQNVNTKVQVIESSN